MRPRDAAATGCRMMRHDVCSAVSSTSRVPIVRLVCQACLALPRAQATRRRALRLALQPMAARRESASRRGHAAVCQHSRAVLVPVLLLFPLFLCVCVRCPSRPALLCSVQCNSAENRPQRRQQQQQQAARSLATGAQQTDETTQDKMVRNTRRHAQLRSGAPPPERTATICAILGAAEARLGRCSTSSVEHPTEAWERGYRRAMRAKDAPERRHPSRWLSLMPVLSCCLCVSLLLSASVSAVCLFLPPLFAFHQSRTSKLMAYVNWRMRITLSDTRQLVGTFLAFDRHMNLVLADTDEYRKVKAKKSSSAASADKTGAAVEEKEEKRTLGLVLLRGECVISLSAEAPPPPKVRRVQFASARAPRRFCDLALKRCSVCSLCLFSVACVFLSRFCRRRRRCSWAASPWLRVPVSVCLPDVGVSGTNRLCYAQARCGLFSMRVLISFPVVAFCALSFMLSRCGCAWCGSAGSERSCARRGRCGRCSDVARECRCARDVWRASWCRRRNGNGSRWHAPSSSGRHGLSSPAAFRGRTRRPSPGILRHARPVRRTGRLPSPSRCFRRPGWPDPRRTLPSFRWSWRWTDGWTAVPWRARGARSLPAPSRRTRIPCAAGIVRHAPAATAINSAS
jgi:small nuclear ribonucleoprotein B and B'